jgi:hypothetical protein
VLLVHFSNQPAAAAVFAARAISNAPPQFLEQREPTRCLIGVFERQCNLFYFLRNTATSKSLSWARRKAYQTPPRLAMISAIAYFVKTAMGAIGPKRSAATAAFDGVGSRNG